MVRQGVSTAISKQSVIEFDTSSGHSEQLPGPTDLLAMALAACLLKNVERFSHVLPFRYEQASVTVVAEQQQAPPMLSRLTYSLHLVTDEPQHLVDLLHRNLQRHGAIYNTLAAACEVSGEVLPQRPHEIVAR